ncbi:MAG: type I restriction enzyme HsdR N-terminal domain-containing protein, partial [Chitinophagales bacterium]
APGVAINQQVLDQAGRYNLVLRVPYLLVSNGNTALCAAIDHAKKTFRLLEDLPPTDQLLLV